MWRQRVGLLLLLHGMDGRAGILYNGIAERTGGTHIHVEERQAFADTLAGSLWAPTAISDGSSRGRHAAGKTAAVAPSVWAPNSDNSKRPNPSVSRFLCRLFSSN